MFVTRKLDKMFLKMHSFLCNFCLFGAKDFCCHGKFFTRGNAILNAIGFCLFIVVVCLHKPFHLCLSKHIKYIERGLLRKLIKKIFSVFYAKWKTSLCSCVWFQQTTCSDKQAIDTSWLVLRKRTERGFDRTCYSLSESVDYTGHCNVTKPTAQAAW